MNKSNGFVGFLLSYFAILINLIYLLMEPLIFTTVGLIYQVQWQYYLITIGGYAALMVVWELIARFARQDGKKVFHCLFVRRLKSILSRFDEQNKKNDEKRPSDKN